uniref:Uncharacterized protein n=1 Tax=Rhizophora mucronata TaxID=61149 RepID=A0A2P2IJX3_RHIMU
MKDVGVYVFEILFPFAILT